MGDNSRICPILDYDEEGSVRKGERDSISVNPGRADRDPLNGAVFTRIRASKILKSPVVVEVRNWYQVPQANTFLGKLDEALQILPPGEV